MSQFNEYPKLMRHPGHRPAQWTVHAAKPDEPAWLGSGSTLKAAELFPDVTVSTMDQEKQYAARGYRPNGVSDQSSYEQAFLESAPTHGYVFQEYPKMKYHPLQAPVIVQDKQEEKALGAGWHDMPVEATEEDLIAEESSQESEPAQAAREGHKPEPKTHPAKKLDKRSKEYKDSLKAQHA